MSIYIDKFISKSQIEGQWSVRFPRMLLLLRKLFFLFDLVKI